jgi:hypothetical protein
MMIIEHNSLFKKRRRKQYGKAGRGQFTGLCYQSGGVARKMREELEEPPVLENPTPKRVTFISYKEEELKLEMLQRRLERLKAKPEPRDTVDEIGIDFIEQAIVDITSRFPKDWDLFRGEKADV